MASYLLLEDGSSKFTLEDSSGFIILEDLSLPIDAQPGSYAVSGADATLERTRVLSASPGSYIITGADAGFGSIARVTQAAIEAVAKGPSDARATQLAVEVLARPIPSARVSQAVIEVVHRNVHEYVQVTWNDD